MKVEDVLFELEPGRSSLLTDSTSPAALRSLLDMLCIPLAAPSLMLVELVKLVERESADPTNVLFGGAG